MATNTINPRNYRQGQSWFSQIIQWGASLFTKDADGYGYWTTLNNAFSFELSELKRLVAAGYLQNPHVYAVVGKMLQESVNIPWGLYRVKSQSELKLYRAFIAKGDIESAMQIRHKAFDIYTEKTDLQKLINRPNGKMSFEQFNQWNLGMLLLTGDAMAYAVKSPMRSVAGILEWIPLPTQYIQVVPKSGWTGEVEKYNLFLDPNKPIPFAPEELLHVKNFNPVPSAFQSGAKAIYSLGLRGMSPLSSLASVVQGSNDGFIAQMKLLQNGGPLGILSNASNMPLLGSQTSDAKNAADQTMNDYSGPWNKGKIRVTTANLKWISLGMNSVDMQLLDLQKATLQNVCNAYNMPLEMMSLEGSTFNNKREALKEMWNGAILPYMNILRDDYNNFLKEYYPEVKSGEVFLDYDHRAVPALQQDIEKMHKIWKERIEIHAATPRMYQEAMGMESVTDDPNLDKYMRTTNLAFGDEALPGMTNVNQNGTNTGANQGN